MLSERCRNAQERDESPFMNAPNGRVGVGVEPRTGLVIDTEDDGDRTAAGRGVGVTGWG